MASWELEKPGTDIKPVFEALLKHVPAPHGDPEKSLQIQISSIQYNDYVGRIGVGRIYNGKIRTGQQVTIVRRDGTQIKSKVQQVQVFEGLGRKNVEEAAAGDIVALIGLESVDIGDSICDPAQPPAAGGDRDRAADADHDVQRERLAVRRHARASTSPAATSASG